MIIVIFIIIIWILEHIFNFCVLGVGVRVLAVIRSCGFCLVLLFRGGVGATLFHFQTSQLVPGRGGMLRFRSVFNHCYCYRLSK